jgi:hypothetical protein
MIQCVWDSELEHWRLRNSDKHSHTIAETDANKRKQLLATTKELLQAQDKLPSRYRKLFPAYSKLTKKQTKNLETWINMTQQTVHYLLNVRNQVDDDPDTTCYQPLQHLTTNKQTAHTIWY